MNESVITILAALLSLLIGIITNLFTESVFDAVKRLLGNRKTQPTETYSEKISRLTNSLSKATAEVDEVLKEITSVGSERAKTVTELEKQLLELTTREKQIKERIEVLEKVPLEAIQQFERILDKGDKRSAWRDYMLFGLGVIVSTVIAIGLNLLGF